MKNFCNEMAKFCLGIAVGITFCSIKSYTTTHTFLHCIHNMVSENQTTKD